MFHGLNHGWGQVTQRKYANKGPGPLRAQFDSPTVGICRNLPSASVEGVAIPQTPPGVGWERAW